MMLLGVWFIVNIRTTDILLYLPQFALNIAELSVHQLYPNICDASRSGTYVILPNLGAMTIYNSLY